MYTLMQLQQFGTNTEAHQIPFKAGPYTIIDKVGPVNYHVQLIGGTQKRVVHRNRLKPCLSDPEPESDVEIKNLEPSSSKQVTSTPFPKAK